jgi:hypothetical protein
MVVLLYVSYTLHRELLSVVIIVRNHCYQIQAKFYPIASSRLSADIVQITGEHHLCLDVTDQLIRILKLSHTGDELGV